jgi:hypothetical protein
MVRTYAVGSNNSAVRRDNHLGAWIPLSPINNSGFAYWKDVMSDPSNPDKVIIVGGNNDGYNIQVSSDAGVTWVQPAGTWFACNAFYEVWYVNTNIIWAVGENGQAVISIDGGASFNMTGSLIGLNAPGDVPFTAAIHALNSEVAVVLGSSTSTILAPLCYAWKTIDGGATWTILNGGLTLYDPSYVGGANGIWMSPDQQTIIVGTGYTQQISIDGGITFTPVGVPFTRSGIHLTWFPTYATTPQYFRHMGGTSHMVNESIDYGASFVEIRGENVETPHQINGGHFYTAFEGYYTTHIDGINYIFATTDGGATGTISYTELNPASIFAAVWTSEYNGPPFYQIVNCENNSTICVTNDMSSEVLSEESFQIEGYPNDCWTAQEIDPSCINPIPIVKLDTFVDCPTCLTSLIPSFCYLLQDCAGLLAPIVTNENLSAYLGTVISIKNEEGFKADGCWIVGEQQLIACEDGVFVEIYACYETCEDCLPPEPCPIPLKPRKVEPNYTTGNCDPEIVESALCNHADMNYHKMMAKRFSIKNCCPVDETATELKFQKINLSLIKGKNPTYDPCNSICYAYEFLVRANDLSVMTYTDCDNVVQIITRNATKQDVLYQFCALNPVAPTVLITHPNNTTETFYLEPVGECKI